MLQVVAESSSDLYAHRRAARIRYRVDEFRRVIPRVGISGSGLVQFWGEKAISRPVGKSDYGPWERVRTPEGLHTVEISDITKITDQKGGRR